MKNPKKVYEILGTDGKSWYRLVYTTAPKTAMRQLMREGWKKSQLKAVIRNPETNWHDRARPRRRNPNETKSVVKGLLPTLAICTAIVLMVSYVGRKSTE